MSYPSQASKWRIAEETSFNGSIGDWREPGGIVTDVSDNDTREVIEVTGIGEIQTQQIKTGVVRSGSSVTMQLQHTRMFSFIAGSVSHTQSTSDWTHTFTVVNNPPTFEAEHRQSLNNDTSYTNKGQTVESAELSIEANGLLTLNLTNVGVPGASGATIQADVADSTLPVFPHSLVSVKLNDVAATEVQNASITFEKTVEPVPGIGSNVDQQIHPTEFKTGFSATLGFENRDYDALFLGGSTTSTTAPTDADPTACTFEIDANNGVTLGSGQRRIRCKLSDCQFSDRTKTATVGRITFVEVTGRGIVDTLIGVDNISDSNWL